MTGNTTRILIADDHQIVLAGLKSLLSSAIPNAVTDTAKQGAEAIDKASKNHYDIFILDVELPDMTGIELAEKLLSDHKDAACIFHTMHEEAWIVKQMMASGADSIVFKSEDIDELCTAVNKVLLGESYYSKRFNNLCTRYEKEVMPSDRELEILRKLASGASSKEIAENSFISVNTVEFHRKRLFRRLGVTNMAELVREAVDRGLLLIS